MLQEQFEERCREADRQFAARETELLRSVATAKVAASRGAEAERLVLRQRAAEIRLQNEEAHLAVQASRQAAEDASRRQRSLRRTLCVSTLFFLVIVAILVAIGFLEREALVRCWNSVNLARTCGSASVPCRGT
jgi:hypothetical protein